MLFTAVVLNIISCIVYVILSFSIVRKNILLERVNSEAKTYLDGCVEILTDAKIGHNQVHLVRSWRNRISVK